MNNPVQPEMSKMMDFRQEVATQVASLLKQAPVSREQIADEMTRLTGVRVSKYMLDAWSSESRDAYNVPFWAIPALMIACKSVGPAEWVTERVKGRAIFGNDVEFTEIGRLCVMRDEIDKRAWLLKAKVSRAD